MARQMKDSGIEWIGEIPVDWSMKRVKHIFTRKNEKVMQENPTILSLARDGVKVRDISNNEGQIAESYYNYNPVEKGDLLLNPMDLYSGANCSISKVQGVISPAYINLRANAGINPTFYDYYFKVQYWLMVFFSYGKGVSYDNRWTLSAETLMNYPAVALSYEEQCKRANYLDRKCAQIDAIISKQQQIIEKLKEYKLSIITEAVTKGLDPNVPMKDSGVEWIEEIPEKWQKAKLKNTCQFINGDRSSNYPSPNDYVDKGIPFLGADSLCGRYVDIAQSKKITNEKYRSMGGAKIQKGDILYTLRGSTIGKNAMAMFDDGTVASSLMVIRPISLVPEFLLYWLNSEEEFQQRQSYINGSTAPNLSADNVGTFILFLPSTVEQLRIANFLDKKCNEIELAIQKKQRMIEKLSDYKKSLIYEVVTGKKEV